MQVAIGFLERQARMPRVRRIYRQVVIAFCLVAIAVPAFPASRGAFTKPFLSEFMAKNDSMVPDEDGDFSDWIEIFNPTGQSVNLGGWFLTDDPLLPTRWRFPDVEIEPGGFLIVFASGKDRATADSELHTDFKIQGESAYLALVEPDGITIAHAFEPSYPDQRTDISYGVDFETMLLIGARSSVTVHVASDDGVGPEWIEPDYAGAPSDWTDGELGVGFNIADLSVAEELLVDLDAYGLPKGRITIWRNLGSPTMGNFSASGSIPEVEEVAGAQAVVFDGVGDWLGSASDAPETITGNENWSVEVWAFNPAIAAQETMLSWAWRSGPGGATALLNYGSSTDSGALEHKGSGNLRYADGPPTSGTWHHIAVTYSGGEEGLERVYVDGVLNTSQTRTLRLHGIGDDHPFPILLGAASSDPYLDDAESHFSGALGAVRVHAGELTAAEVRSNFLVDAEYYGLAADPTEDALAPQIGMDIEETMYGVASSVYLRIPFQVEDLDRVDTLALRIQYDDGFVAYLNGAEIARRNAPQPVAWNSTATDERTDKMERQIEFIGLTARLADLRQGENILAIQGLNRAVSDADFRIVPELIGATIHLDRMLFFKTPSPERLNGGGIEFVDTVQFSHAHGFYEESFALGLQSRTEGAEIRYTLNGSDPGGAEGRLYANPIEITSTSIVRAIATKEGLDPSRVRTQTYLFLQDVIRQSPTGLKPTPEWPAPGSISQVMDYGMDPEVVNDERYRDQIMPALLSIRTMSIVTDLANLFHPETGIYSHPTEDGAEWERPTSLEEIHPDGSEGFQVDAGLRIRGGFSRTTGNPKHAFRLFFRERYGEAKLRYPLFGDEGAEDFDKVDLRTAQNYSWSFSAGELCTMNREVFSRDTQRDTGEPYTRSRYYHLYLNGQYWGLFMTEERPEARFAESYLGGDKRDYDVIKADPALDYQINATDGDREAYKRLWSAAKAGFASDAAYWRAQGRNVDGSRNPDYEVQIDTKNVIDYMLAIYYVGSTDAPMTGGGDRANNFYAIRNREGEEGWRFFMHDSEHSLLDPNLDRLGPFDAGTLFEHFNPQWLLQRLTAHPEFVRLLGDYAHKRFRNGGAMSDAVSIARFLARKEEIDLAIIGESARWGDATSARPRTRDDDWLANIARISEVFLPGRADRVIEQMRQRGWYPRLEAPIFYIDGFYQYGGRATGPLEMDNDYVSTTTLLRSGAIWRYLDDGSDQGAAWRAFDFDDSNWASGPSLLASDTKPYRATTINAGSFVTTYFRHAFDLPDKRGIKRLTLRLARDDGAVVYLNGKELLRDNMPKGEIDYRTSAASGVGLDREWEFQPFENLDLDAFRNGKNVLAVEVHQSGESTDTTFDLEIDLELQTPGLITETIYYTLDGTDPRVVPVSAEATTGTPAPGARPYTGPIDLDAGALVKARTYEDGEWSALTEALYLVHAAARRGLLAVSEINYNPYDPTDAELVELPDANNDDFEFLELQNVGVEPIDLTGARFTRGIEFDFTNAAVRTLAPSACLLLVKDRAAFELRYGKSLSIAGVYGGQLSNGGERLTLIDLNGEEILDFSYGEAGGWPEAADGAGASLELRYSARGDPDAFGDPSSWRASDERGGSPGAGVRPAVQWMLY